MDQRQLGRHSVSVVGLGCNNFGRRIGQEEARRVVDAAIDSGINFFDTADVYGSGDSERFLGAALGSRRDEVIIATKFGHQMSDSPQDRGGSRRWVTKAVEDSLQRLQTDRIDLYQMHTPDPDVDIEETLTALDDLVRAGKVLDIGHSNFNGDQMMRADEVARDSGTARFVSAQNHLSLLHTEMEPGAHDACRKLGLSLLPYFPLASGALTGKYRRNEPMPEDSRLAAMPEERRRSFLDDDRFEIIEKLEAFADQRGRSLLDLAFAWLLADDLVASVIAGATKPEQVTANAGTYNFKLTEEDLVEIDAIAGTSRARRASHTT